MKELAPPNVNLKRLYQNETLPNEPVLIIISPGADPSQELRELAADTVGVDKYHDVRITGLYSDIVVAYGIMFMKMIVRWI